MKPQHVRRFALGLLLGAAAAAQTPAPQHLPLTRVILYKSGVGFFEYDGGVTGNQQVEIDLTSTQLNDVLKSLTALDLNGGRITGASYNSQAPVGQQLSTLAVPVANRTTLTALLESLRGAELSVQTAGGGFSGRLLSVETRQREVNGVPSSSTGTSTEISVLSDGGPDSGEVRTFELGATTSFRFLDRGLQRELNQALGLLDASHAQDTRRLLLSADGVGSRQLQVSYISEVPVWKTTYRVVLPATSAAKPLLQGWAVVDNTIGEDWNNVALTLASGAPQSFIEALSQPLYVSRPIVAPPRGYLPAPQLHAESEQTNTVEVAGEAPLIQPQQSGMASAAAAPAAGRGGRGGGGAVGFSDLSVPPSPPPPSAQFQFAANQSSVTPALGSTLGELFQYALQDKVTIHKNESALVPIVQTPVTAEKVSLWSAVTRPAFPLRALWLTNTSSLVLDGGSFNVIDDNAFGGEGLMDSMQPGERRLISYATDLGLRVTTETKSDPSTVARMKIAEGNLTETDEVRRHIAYTVQNADLAPRTMVVEQAKPSGDWKLTTAMQPEDETTSLQRFRFTAAAKTATEFQVHEVRSVDTTLPLSLVGEANLDLWRHEQALTPELDKALQQIVTGRTGLAALDDQITEKQAQRNQIVSDQARVRANLAALVKGAPDEKTLAESYTRTLSGEETQLTALAADITTLQAQRKKAQDDLDAFIQGLNIDANVSGTMQPGE